jgi:hypothetical protein
LGHPLEAESGHRQTRTEEQTPFPTRLFSSEEKFEILLLKEFHAQKSVALLRFSP